jgi:hypothetical protein
VRAIAKSTVQFPPDNGDEPLNVTLVEDAGAPEGESTDDGTPLDEDGDMSEVPSEGPAKPAPPRHFTTVREAAKGSCTTASIEGLSKQIIAEARCLNPKAVAPLPSRPNLVTGPNVFPYLRADAKDHLVKVLDAHKGTTLKIHSALRTVAQQYLVWRWSTTKSCGVELATPPGKSNHELGLALDIADHTAWRSALEAEHFKWLGASDRVHFDFETPEDASKARTDVLAFQRLWNRNHPTDRVAENGLYGPPTEQRLETAPPDGFPIGPSCSAAGRKRAL